VAKQNGLGDRLIVGGYNISGDVASIAGMNGGPALLDVTAIDASGRERLGAARDGMIDFATFFNDAAAQQHIALRGLPSTDVHVMYLRGTTLGNKGICLVGKEADYKPSRPGDGSMGFNAQFLANGYGIEANGEQLTAGSRTDTGATNGTAVDYGDTSTLFGLTAYLQVTAFTGTDVTIKLQDSADNSSFADITAGGFAQITTGPQTQRIQTSLTETIRRYVRVATVTTGGFTSVTFYVVFMRHRTAMAY